MCETGDVVGQPRAECRPGQWVSVGVTWHIANCFSVDLPPGVL